MKGHTSWAGKADWLSRQEKAAESVHSRVSGVSDRGKGGAVNKVDCHTRCRVEFSPWGVVPQAERRSGQGPGANEKPRQLGQGGERRRGRGTPELEP